MPATVVEFLAGWTNLGGIPQITALEDGFYLYFVVLMAAM